MPDRAALATSLTSPEAFLALYDEPGVMGAKKKAQAAFDLWSRADRRYVGSYRGFVAPGGPGTGFVIRTFWDPTEVTPDLDAIEVAIHSALPVALTKADEKATWRGATRSRTSSSCGRAWRSGRCRSGSSSGSASEPARPS